ncbi:uncharacterized protein BJ171DRAFT_532216 [Polychytrium aggregatum]|uniref:uncharacterized protein n=1 Tax=Polychytrium aggregatum TaxID=110093 RepID=UPI0022FDBDB6|nr:uncharacterized protein BJ171DRAFT_532216 [Polychytrium aggregatum]KAI9193229.1 hypothetical protein BJ171DRAFT_532216 [Polychytrium aggregatum]
MSTPALRTAAARATRAAFPSTILASVARMSSNIRESGGSFGKREVAQEEKYIHDHEKDVLKKFKDTLDKKASAPAAESAKPEGAQKPAEADSEHINPTPVDSNYGGNVRSGGGAFGKREAVLEEKYFRDHDRELAQNLRNKQK